jgi:UPF0716 protein FxsA
MMGALPVRLAVIVYVVAELALIVLAVRWLGGAAVFLWVLATAALGVWVARREGIRAVETMRIAMQERRPPARAVPDRGMVATGGVLLVLPGLLTDLFGILMVVPATRPAARRLLTGLATAVMGKAPTATVIQPETPPVRPAPGPVIQGEVLDSRDEPAD